MAYFQKKFVEGKETELQAQAQAEGESRMAEIMGRADGYCRGRGGSMHIADRRFNNLGANGIVGGGIPIATGAAMGVKVRGTDQVVVCFFSDGASNNGVNEVRSLRETVKYKPLKNRFRIVVIDDHTLFRRGITALLARGHVLIEGYPGVAKTTLVKAFSGKRLIVPIVSDYADKF